MLKPFMTYVTEIDQKSSLWILHLKNGWKLRFKPSILQTALSELRFSK